MTQSVELLLDPAAEARVVGEWVRLDEAGLASQIRHRGASNRPHLTLTAGPSVAADAEPLVAEACSDRLPLETRLGAVAVFGSDPVVLVRLVVPSRSLLDLQAAVAGLVDLDEGSLLAPGRWTPHVTLARRMPLEQLAAALRVLGGTGEDPVRFVAARRWDGTARRAWTLG